MNQFTEELKKLLKQDIVDLTALNTEFIHKLILQIRKEFVSFDWEVLQGDFKDGDLDRVKSYLRYDIEDFYAKNTQLFTHFLYRVDISNEQIQQYTQEHIFEDVYECVAELVIIRCAQKVYYKIKYSS